MKIADLVFLFMSIQINKPIIQKKKIKFAALRFVYNKLCFNHSRREKQK